ncbi:MAG TPA: efflux RND transporter periplasmic adaptor subunit [Chitinophagaceae bacterium]|nr:efflux RND transporter periplasmic adaptor subunit [Chitinophagaceae bacterium]
MKILVIIASILVFLAACNSKTKTVAEANTKYTCSMHPQVMKDEPGECPICHMDLIPVHNMHADSAQHDQMKMPAGKGNGDSAGKESMASMGGMQMSNEIELTEQQVKLAGIQTYTIGSAGFGNNMVLTGTVTFNEKNIENISARVKGRIERLYFKNVGDYVPKGTKVYELYSEELNSAKQEYILLLQRGGLLGKSVINFNQLVEAAKHKLLLWGMTSSQIRSLEQSHKTSYTTTFYSTIGGYITQLNVTEGNYVMEGQSMVRLANTSSVWVETQAYTSQLSQINNKGKVIVQIPQLSNMKVTGAIEFASPEVNPQTRINLLRVSIPNPGNQLKPGMTAYIYLSNEERTAFSVPIDAVMRSKDVAMVWIQTGADKFSMRKIITGAENGNMIEISNGLKQGDAVVTSGAYLLNSEYLLRNGVSSMAGMNM